MPWLAELAWDIPDRHGDEPRKIVLGARSGEVAICLTNVLRLRLLSRPVDIRVNSESITIGHNDLGIDSRVRRRPDGVQMRPPE